MKLIPYVYFQGNCEEALNTYAKIFNGEIEGLTRYAGNFPAPEDHKNKILHASLLFGENVIMFSDSMPGGTVNYGNGHCLCLGLNDEPHARNVFNQLAEGGKIKMEMEKQFWGVLYGEVFDKFGIHWMINCELPADK